MRGLRSGFSSEFSRNLSRSRDAGNVLSSHLHLVRKSDMEQFRVGWRELLELLGSFGAGAIQMRPVCFGWKIGRSGKDMDEFSGSKCCLLSSPIPLMGSGPDQFWGPESAFPQRSMAGNRNLLACYLEGEWNWMSIIHNWDKSSWIWGLVAIIPTNGWLDHDFPLIIQQFAMENGYMS